MPGPKPAANRSVTEVSVTSPYPPDLAHALDLRTVAEGVETSAELDFLKSELCNEAQGFLLGRPADIETFRRLTSGEDASDAPTTVVSLASKASSG